MEIDRPNTLEMLYDIHNPSPQPWSWAEELYLKMMSEFFLWKINPFLCVQHKVPGGSRERNSSCLLS